MLRWLDKNRIQHLLICLFFLCGSMQLQAQSNVRMTDFWDNLYSINPAYLSNKYLSTISLSTRKQWMGFPGAPATYMATGTIVLDKLNAQFGIKAYQDVIGYTNTSSASLSYTYAVNLDEEWRLHLGIAASFQSLWYDMDKIRVEYQLDPTLTEKLARTNHYNADLGAELASKSLRIGVSGANVFSLFRSDKQDMSNANYIYATYRNYTEDSRVDLSGGICGINNRNLYQLELNGTVYFKTLDQDDIFQVGLFYRTPNEMGATAGWNVNKYLFLAYSYDYNVSGISRSSSGTHELTLILRINKKDDCHTCY